MHMMERGGDIGAIKMQERLVIGISPSQSSRKEGCSIYIIRI